MAARRPPTDDEYWRRLEAAGPRLTDARLRYRALLPALRAWGWKGRLRALVDVAQAAVHDDAVVAADLERAERRAAQEGWAEGEIRTLLEETRALRDALTQRASILSSSVLSELVEDSPPPSALSEPLDDARDRPVDDSPSTSLARSLSALLATVIGVPRAVPRGDRDAAAAEALSLDPTLTPALELLGETLERVFSRPVQRGKRLPFSLEEFDAAWDAREAGAGVLERAWTAVERIDTTGGVERELQRRAKRAGRSPKHSLPGPRALVRAAFWFEASLAAVDAVLVERFAPVEVLPAERTDALRFLCAREVEGATRLQEKTPRAALLMLAHELAATPEDRAPLQGGRAQVHAWAVAADQHPDDADHRRLLDGLRTLSSKTLRGALPPLYRVGKPAERGAAPMTLAELFPA